MSATKRGAKRREADYYPTPLATAMKCVGLMRPPTPDPLMCEPSAGCGSFATAMLGTFPSKYQIDAIEPDNAHSMALSNTLALHYPITLEKFKKLNPDLKYDIIAGNPPFSLAKEHIDICLTMLLPRGQLGQLLPLSFLASAKRKEWLKSTPLKCIHVLGRPSFVHVYACKKLYKSKEPGCGWSVTVSPEGAYPIRCLDCGNIGLTKTTTDAQDYGFYIWEEGYEGEPIVRWA
jgi:hypothetical protein